MATPARLSRAVAVVAAIGLGALAGCQDPTEIVVAADTDATPGTDFMFINFQLSTNMGASSTADHLPATWGLTRAGMTEEFDVTVTLNQSFGPDATHPAFVTRKASHVRFVEHEMKVLFIPLFKSCACNGTNCPNPVPPECGEITAPVLQDFDEDNIPHLPKK